jgi:hypothetical protein
MGKAFFETLKADDTFLSSALSHLDTETEDITEKERFQRKKDSKVEGKKGSSQGLVNKTLLRKHEK